MTRDVRAAFFLILLVAVVFAFQGRDREPATPEEALQAVLATVSGQTRLDALPLKQAIKQIHGNGERVLVSFEDPNCTYCIKLNKNLHRLDNVTLYTFLIPMLSEDSVVKSRRIWCASDPASAWNDWMLRRRLPSGAGDCDTTALDKNLELGEKMGVWAVPTVFQAE